MSEECSFSENVSSEILDESNSVTMLDVLAGEKALEEDANAVLGDSDDKNCTYPLGYIKRQALYACLTCNPSDANQRAGVCLACSYHCHENHDLVELYTKRNFKCDCGTKIFNGKKCSLLPDKPLEENEKNRYNQNFIGLYCSCSKPYPDPDDDVEDVMIQCIICEDWYHSRHLNTEINSSTEFSEMVCGPCVKQNQFLLHYSDYHLNKPEVIVDVTSVSDSKNDESKSGFDKPLYQHNVESNDKLGSYSVNQVGSSSNEVLEKKISSTNQSGDEIKTETSEYLESSQEKIMKNVNGIQQETASKKCILPPLNNVATVENKALFFCLDWRKNLCTCTDCIKIYEANGVEFLIDEGDTVLAYEERGRNKEREGQYEQGLKALSSLDRVQQVEALTEYNELKNHLHDYLQKFVENKKVVREEDIREFFSGMNETRKKRKYESPPFYCH